MNGDTSVLRAIIVTEELKQKVRAPRLKYRANPHFFKTKRWMEQWNHTFNPICQGCKQELKVGEAVYEFRSNNFVHTHIGCVRQVDKYRVTKALKKLSK